MLVFGPAPLAAQELALTRDYPGFGPFECPAPATYAPPAPEDEAQAGQLASDAIQAVILGELPRAQELLARATELDASSAELAYRHARVLEDMAVHEQAMLEYCRALALGAEDVGISDSRVRIEAIYEIVRDQISPVARQAFTDGITLADGGYYAPAVDEFSRALEEAPDWGPAIYNRAVVLEAMGLVTESLDDYRRYLEVTPSEIDPVVARVTERIGLLEGMVALPTPSPAGALALGVAFPGMGQYYSGRGLATAGAAVVTGLMFKEVTVRCLTPSPDGDCPPGDVVDETTKRPYLLPALGAGVAVTLVGAIEAWVRARGRRAEASATAAEANVEATRSSQGLELAGPSLTTRGGRVEVALIGVRFR
jgi:tetratricopeptide (TPR) repeat protein